MAHYVSPVGNSESQLPGDLTPVSAARIRSADRILQRTIEVIEESGETAVRTNLIAVECGVTAPILYRAFQSREGLIVAAQAARYRRSISEAADFIVHCLGSCANRADALQQVERILEFVLSPDRAPNRRLRTEVMGSAVSRPALRAEIVTADQDFVARITPLLVDMQDKGWMAMQVRPGSVVSWAFSLLNGHVSREFDNSKIGDPDWAILSHSAILAAIFGGVVR